MRTSKEENNSQDCIDRISDIFYLDRISDWVQSQYIKISGIFLNINEQKMKF